MAIGLPDVRSRHALERAEAASISYPAAFWAVALAALALRLAASFVFDLNLMESYGAVMARYPSLSYADHPPLTWWLIGLVTHIAGSEAAPVVRAPFIVLFLGTSWLLYRITERLFGAKPAFFAAAALTLSPLFGLWVGALALTDGLAIFFVLASVRCLIVIFFKTPQNRQGIWLVWLLAGLLFGLALASKYTAILLVPGLLLFLVTGASARRGWLTRPEPYAAILAAAIPLLPVLIWLGWHAVSLFATLDLRRSHNRAQAGADGWTAERKSLVLRMFGCDAARLFPERHVLEQPFSERLPLGRGRVCDAVSADRGVFCQARHEIS